MRTLETVDRALQMLLAFDGDEEVELTVAALASRLGIHRSSASRFAATLAARGFLERAPGSDAFRLGPALARLGLLAMGARGLIDAARPVMERLAEETGEAVVLSVLADGEAADVAQVDGPHLIGMRNWVGRRAPLESSSDGKVLLAFGDADATPTPAGVERELERVRERGWASAESELEEGLNGVAVPVWDVGERCIAALSVSGPAYRLPAERFADVAAQIAQAAHEISTRLGRPGGEAPATPPR